MTTHMIMDASGHSTIQFNPSNNAEVSEAMARFKELTSKGYTAAAREPGTTGDYKLTRKFNPEDELLFVPHMQGG